MLGTTNVSASQASMNTLNISINGVSKLTYNGKDTASLDISLSSLGAAAASHDHDSVYSKLDHTHSYLPLSGGTMTGQLTLNSPLRIYDCTINELGTGNLWLNNTLCSVKDQGSYNMGWFHIHNGTFNMYFENDTVFLINHEWYDSGLNTYINASDFGIVSSPEYILRIQRYTYKPTIDTYRIANGVSTFTGNIARCYNIDFPNEGAMYFSEPDKYIYGDIGGWLRIGCSAYFLGTVHVHGDINTIGGSYYQNGIQGSIVTMQEAEASTEMLWAW